MPTAKHFISRQEQRRLNDEARRRPHSPGCKMVRFEDLPVPDTEPPEAP